MRHAIYLPPLGPLADPVALVDLAVGAEDEGWDAVFLWDHIMRPAHEPAEIADAWVALSAIATKTTRIRLGPMVTPLVRRRPQKVAREIITLDHLSRGRLTVGFGLGVQDTAELSAFGEMTVLAERVDALDEGCEVIAQLVAGESIDHVGAHYRASGVAFRPLPIQRPRPPIWLAARGRSPRALRRASRYEGIFPVNVTADDVAWIREHIAAQREDTSSFDVAVVGFPGLDMDAFERSGATWCAWSFIPGQTPTDVADFVTGGPSRWI